MSRDEAVPLLRGDKKLCNCDLYSKTCVGINCVVLVAAIIGISIASLGHLSGSTVPAGIAFHGTENLNTVIRLRPSLNDPSSPAMVSESLLKDAGGKGRHGYLAVVSNTPPTFHIEGSCSSLAKTSVTASVAGCRHAVNGGPFNSYWKGGCIGPMISHGHVLSQDWNTTYAAFGMTASGEWIMGHISQELHGSLNIVETVTGFGWLVRDGQSVAPADEQVAERTAIGLNARGELIMLEVDGCERCPFTGGPSGLTLHQLAALLVSHGALHAINLDGGGSSTTVIDGKVRNKPDCLELGLRCERPVTSVVCVA